MASGKLSARQKMINLMYLVFIAMLALNMSKEVLSAFGSINTKLDRANNSFNTKNDLALNDLKKKAGENDEFAAAAATAQNASNFSKTFYDYLESQKEMIFEGNKVEDRKDFESMDKTTFLAKTYYRGGKVSPEGKQFLDQMDTYRNGMISLIGDSNKKLADQIAADFSTGDILNRDNKKQNYLEYNFVGFPTISSLTKMTQIQNDIKVVENELLSKLLSGNLKELAKLDNYETVMTTSKGAYYTGSTFDGVLSLGRVDASTKPARVELKLDGRAIPSDKISFDGGKLVLGVGTGGVGDHNITGSLFYPQDGKEIEVVVDQKFTTINKPNSATIAADKMNVVYRGVQNPMTITFAGVADNKVKANGAGLRPVSGSKYMMSPGTGKEVTINVSATLPDGGGTVSDKATFRIKNIPRPVGTMRNDDSGALKMTREAVGGAPVGAALPDFDFELNLKVSSFKFKAPGSATVLVQGTKLNAQAKAALAKAKRGSTVQIFEIKAQIQGNTGYKMGKVSPVLIELTN
ncbi:gliding motility protein GldM [Dokdonia sp.]|uniref:type IX secretion system motor protein PorM/GldM n=1 Tax=Dokdonia sp. TaxID=2024995 RepID=UPI003262FA43